MKEDKTVVMILTFFIPVALLLVLKYEMLCVAAGVVCWAVAGGGGVSCFFPLGACEREGMGHA